MDLLNEIFESRGRYSYPQFVISISRSQEVTDKFQERDGLVHKSIIYDASSEAWKKELLDYIKKCIDIVRCRVQKRNYKYDLVVVCAMKEELDPFLDLLDKMEKSEVRHSDFVSYEGSIQLGDRELKVIAVYALSKGSIVAAAVTTKVITEFIPRYIAMIGIAGGYEDKTNFGDVIVATHAWNYNAGKEIVKDDIEKHKNEIHQIDIESEFERYIEDIANDEKVQGIKEGYLKCHEEMVESITWDLEVKRGLVATGASVVANKALMEKIRSDQSRDALAVEMEILGFYYACHWAQKPKPMFIALKAISDFGDNNKNDDFHGYAAYTSAKVLEILVKNYFEFE